MVRTEECSYYMDLHLGRVSNDGPASTSLRYRIKSAALQFILGNEPAKEGYRE